MASLGKALRGFFGRGDQGPPDVIDPLADEKASLAEARRSAAHDPQALPDLADELLSYSMSAGIGEFTAEAVAAAEEGIALYRTLVSEEPDIFSEDLADALSTYALALTDGGRRDEAAEAMRECVALYRDLSSDDPATFTAQFAAALHQYAGVEADDALALDASQEAVAQYRAAVTAGDELASDIADFLAECAAQLKERGHLDEAEALASEAAEWFRQEHSSDDQLEDWLKADTMVENAQTLLDLGRIDEAILATGDVIRVTRDRAIRGDDDGYRVVCAEALELHAHALGLAGRSSEAAAAAHEASGLRDGLTDRHQELDEG